MEENQWIRSLAQPSACMADPQPARAPSIRLPCHSPRPWIRRPSSGRPGRLLNFCHGWSVFKERRSSSGQPAFNSVGIASVATRAQIRMRTAATTDTWPYQSPPRCTVIFHLSFSRSIRLLVGFGWRICPCLPVPCCLHRAILKSNRCLPLKFRPFYSSQ